MELKVVAAQMGPFFKDYDANLAKAMTLLDNAAAEHSPDVVLFSEMMTAAYFGGVRDDRYFALAEGRDGKFATAMSAKARELNIHIIGTWFEKEETDQGPRYFNSAGLFSPDQGLCGVYRKTHLPKVETEDLVTDEKYYFSEGDELPTFNINGVEIGILICYDRSFPEAWRTLWLKGAQVIFVSVATYGFRQKIFTKELEVRAAENHVFVVAANKAGEESVENERLVRNHFGSSCVIDPNGNLLQQLDDKPFSMLCATLDMEKIRGADSVLDWKRDRRPSLYGNITV